MHLLILRTVYTNLTSWYGYYEHCVYESVEKVFRVYFHKCTLVSRTNRHISIRINSVCMWSLFSNLKSIISNENVSILLVFCQSEKIFLIESIERYFTASNIWEKLMYFVECYCRILFDVDILTNFYGMHSFSLLFHIKE